MKNLLFPIVLIMFFVFSACTNEKNFPTPVVEKHIIIPNDSESTNKYQVDSFITFNPLTYEEKLTKIITYQTDTIITFDPETNTEEVQLVKTIISTQEF